MSRNVFLGRTTVAFAVLRIARHVVEAAALLLLVPLKVVDLESVNTIVVVPALRETRKTELEGTTGGMIKIKWNMLRKPAELLGKLRAVVEVEIGEEEVVAVVEEAVVGAAGVVLMTNLRMPPQRRATRLLSLKMVKRSRPPKLLLRRFAKRLLLTRTSPR
jgi:hypothetical protein